ncbi:MAG: galactose-1-phosphate uridylyltransferase [Vicinamibacterales bacterium]
MFKQSLTKPDGRYLLLYGTSPIAHVGEVRSPSVVPFAPNAHLRWHPLRGEWVAYATHRQNRTFLPPPEYNPLARTTDAAHPTELPSGQYDVAVFQNLFPALTGAAHDPPDLNVPTRPARGECEVVVFTDDVQASLGALSLDRIVLILDVWADRYDTLGARADVDYVFPFENRGVEVGVTLHHPHGQIYAYPFIPPVPARELEQQRTYLEKRGRGLLEDLVAAEEAHRSRVLYAGPHVVAFVPVCARYPYEVWIAPRRAAASVSELSTAERRDLAVALKTVLLTFDHLWAQPFPYIMAMHQAPTDGLPHPEAHVHLEFYPAYRMRDRLKYLAGSEIGAGVFTADTDPDERAAELRAALVPGA